MSTSAVPATIDYLVTTFTTAATLGAANPPVSIIDGPAVSEAFPKRALYVGLSDPDTSPGAPTAATTIQEWAGMPARTRKETFSIFCTAESWSGSTDIRTARLDAYAIVAAVEDLVRVDKYLGGNANVDPGITNLTLRQNNTTTGAVAQVQFELGLKSRIGA